jgi:hypothetical protein
MTDVTAHTLTTYAIVLDVEENGYEGWNEVDSTGSSGCSSRGGSISTALDRATFNGFWHWIWDHTSYHIDAYSAPGIWTSIFGTGSDSVLHTTTEITADWGGDCANPAPSGWSQDASGSCSANSAGWFGGIDKTSDCAFGWQWHGSGSADYDQIDTARAYTCQ